jgi:hypothetical protein
VGAGTIFYVDENSGFSLMKSGKMFRKFLPFNWQWLVMTDGSAEDNAGRGEYEGITLRNA